MINKHTIAGGFLIAVALTLSVMWLMQEWNFDGTVRHASPQTQAAAPMQAIPKPAANRPVVATRVPTTQTADLQAAELGQSHADEAVDPSADTQALDPVAKPAGA